MEAERLVIGVGNRWRQDDGVGLAAAEAVANLNLPNVRVLFSSAECSGLLDMWEGAGCVYVIDAAVGPDAGTIHRFDPAVRDLPAELFGCSSHNFGVVHAIKLARTLQRLPGRLVVYGVAGRRFAVGEGLSPEVARAIPMVVDDIRRELESVDAALKPDQKSRPWRSSSQNR